ncbi:MAG: hypothetical protein AUG51_17045 [Acidobacteria bacterium 13_1_20CM_3_53_8]|nr:MAG: hypothetical protein AUG51_17045 [Acidobacteria bacterium 13_1_20CM_3_53_8]
MKPYYEEKNIQLYCADWQEILPELKEETVGLLCTDPPYATTNLQWDKPVNWVLFWQCVERLCKWYATQILFSSGLFTNKLINTNPKHFRYELIWEKTMPTGFLDANRRPLRAHENILFFIHRPKASIYNPQFIAGKLHKRGSEGTRALHYGSHRKTASVTTNKYHPRSIIRFPNARCGKSLHPTMKPLHLIEFLIRSYSNRGHLVLDPFVGSGTTLLATKRTGRRAIGIEREEKYCEIAAKRLRGEL